MDEAGELPARLKYEDLVNTRLCRKSGGVRYGVFTKLISKLFHHTYFTKRTALYCT